MKYLFILNQQAGTARVGAKLEEELRALRETQGIEYILRPTASAEEAEHWIRRTCGQGGEVCVVACGGDGTFSGAVNAAAGFAGASVGVMPVGTGNDFVRNFGDKSVFLDPAALLAGETVQIDLLRCGDRLCANMINIGFDCEVVKQAGQLRRNRWLGEKMAYISGVVATLVRKPGVTLTAAADDSEPEENDLLLIAIANGAFCGGGFCAAPYSSTDDGKMDVCLVNDMSRTRFLSLVKSYHDGTYLQKKAAEKLIRYRQCQKLELEFPQKQSICIDGEIIEDDRLTVEVLPRALRFLLPRGAVRKGAGVYDTACPF